MRQDPVPSDVRNGWLRLSDEALVKQCREERHRASGPGGQRRNKVETAIRLRHEPSGVVSQATESRYLAVNRRKALHRLRERIARAVRSPFDLESPTLPAELNAARREKALSINQRNPAYPVVLATILDAVAAAGHRYSRCAQPLGVTTTQLVRFIRSDREAWRALQESRGPAADVVD